MWLVIFDNINGKFPEGFFLTVLKNFLNFIKESTDVEAIVLSEKKFKTIIIKSGIVIEKIAMHSKVDGIIISFTRSAVESIIVDEDLRKYFLDIVGRLKENAPIIFCTGKFAFEKIKKYLKDVNVVFEQKMKVNWFTIDLKNKFKRLIKK